METNVQTIDRPTKISFLDKAITVMKMADRVNELQGANVNVTILSGHGSPIRSMTVYVHRGRGENILSLHYYEENMLSIGLGNSYEEIIDTLNYYIKKGETNHA